MNAFLYGVVLHWKLDIRNKGVLLTYYVVPLVFFAFMGGIFTSINPIAKDTLIQSMTIFGVTMGAILGAPTPLVELYGSEIKKAYKVGGIPLWVAGVNNFISAFVHLFIMSLVIFFIAPLAFNTKIPENLILYFLYLGIFIIACVAVGTVLGVLIKSTSKLTMTSQFIFLPSIMLAGIMFPVNMLPKALESLGEIFPATWGFKLMTSETFDVKIIIPLVIIMFVSICISVYELSRINLE
ncbi:ABC transporter permease [Clostridiaceae bacterium UIB06]|uniref:ABC transporter permease n=1 Tax=Clostridium thailandense TaxID=2794346 RepID=A0A949U2R4_9CLOT|nr:ABC transporter permease [Clostridium thailandense]MBV7275279.1 ABC transporter permease [Clostridium thailandense]MCH5135795.1 ABC transporter permease [Clostridiaceae bacterium UIB06]